MNLQEATDKLEGIMPDYLKAQKEYADFQDELMRKISFWYRQDENTGLKNAEMREAHLNSYLDNEGILNKKLELSNNFYRLKAEKDFLTEISKSLRIIEGAK